MAKITEMTEDTAVGGSEKVYLVDGSQDKFALLTSLKSLFASSVPTLAALKAYQGLSDNQVIQLIGGTADNDAKSGLFYWDNSATDVADDTDIIAVTGVLEGRWKRLLEQKYLRGDVADTVSGVLNFTAVPTYNSIPLISPAGSIVFFGADEAPDGWLECDGAEISRSTYSALFSAIGTTFGTGDGANTFDLPDLRGEFIRVWDHGRGIDTARAFASSQAQAIQSHQHTFPVYRSNGSADLSTNEAGVRTDADVRGTVTTAASGGTETRPRNIALMACIKY